MAGEQVGGRGRFLRGPPKRRREGVLSSMMCSDTQIHHQADPDGPHFHSAREIARLPRRFLPAPALNAVYAGRGGGTGTV